MRSSYLCLSIHKAHIRIRFLTPSVRFLFCDRCGAIR